jgi:hypothetical protein
MQRKFVRLTLVPMVVLAAAWMARADFHGPAVAMVRWHT